MLKHMDEAVKKIAERYEEIQRQIRILTKEAQSIKQVMASIGYRPAYLSEAFADSGPSRDEQYAEMHPFKHATLVDACKQTLMDHQHQGLTKNEVEYLVTVGGYEFSTADRKNSVDVTLRRLAKEGFCQVDAKMGPKGNTYMWTRETAKKE